MRMIFCLVLLSNRYPNIRLIVLLNRSLVSKITPVNSFICRLISRLGRLESVWLASVNTSNFVGTAFCHKVVSLSLEMQRYVKYPCMLYFFFIIPQLCWACTMLFFRQYIWNTLVCRWIFACLCSLAVNKAVYNIPYPWFNCSHILVGIDNPNLKSTVSSCVRFLQTIECFVQTGLLREYGCVSARIKTETIGRHR